VKNSRAEPGRGREGRSERLQTLASPKTKVRGITRREADADTNSNSRSSDFVKNVASSTHSASTIIHQIKTKNAAARNVVVVV
jgi:hypothetical protein